MSELAFRIAFSALWLIFVANLTWVRLEARTPHSENPSGPSAQRQNRLHMVGLALFAPVWFGGIILYAIAPQVIGFLSIPLPDWFRLVMAGLAALSMAFTFWGYRTIGKNWVHAFEPSDFKGETLVTWGPYRYVRNPIYLGAFTFIIALALLASNWLTLVPAMIIIPLVYMQIDGEEKMLRSRFGEEYLDYVKRTPRIIPGFRRRPSE